VSFDALGRVVTWNPRAERVFGRRASDAIGRRPSEVFANGPARAIALALEQVLRRGAVQRIALQLETRDGESIRGSLHLAPLADWERRTVGASAVLEEESSALALAVAHDAARRLLARDDLPPEARAEAEAVLRAGEPS
jgi:PAS domain S-box-containing protein